MLRQFSGNLTILVLHRVVTEEEKAQSLNKPMMITEDQFESLLKAIRRYCCPISLSDAVQKIRDGRKFEPGTVAITFDDGYYDVYERAYPKLKSYDIPATMFVTTGVIDNPQYYLWWDEVDYLSRTGRVGSILLSEEHSEDLKRALYYISRLPENRSARIEAQIRHAFSDMPVAERLRFVGRIREAACELGPRQQLMLTWDNIREMSDVFEFANHTVNHPFLSSLESPEIQQELEGAKAKIEEETERQCTGLAYPSGDFSNDVISIAESLGFEYAVTTRFSNNSQTSDLMCLGRKDAGYLYLENKISPAYFNVVLSGVIDWLRGRGEGRNAGDTAQTGQYNCSHTYGKKGKPHDSNSLPLIVHVVHHLTIGGLENGLVNLINRLPQTDYRHVVVCLTDYSDFKDRIRSPDVEVLALHKRPGKDFKIYLDLWRLFRRLKPNVVHTRNIATLEAQLPALFAGVPHRIHGEHGRDSRDIDGGNTRYQLLRKIFRPVITHYIALSCDLHKYLQAQVGVPGRKISRICNGVDTEKFKPAGNKARIHLPDGFNGEEMIIIGTVGRMEPEKDPATLAEAFIRLVKRYPQGREKLRLVMVGDGVLRDQVKTLFEHAGVTELVWLPGERDDVSLLLQSIDVFVLSSLIEGVSNTILEAMASGLPVVATHVGGNSEIVDEEVTGLLVPRSDPTSLAAAIQRYIEDPEMRQRHGALARRRIEEEFTIDKMVQQYHELYVGLLYSNSKTTLLSRSSY